MIFKMAGCAVLSIGLNTVLAQSAVVINLRTEHLQNPIGIDNFSPRFTWQIDANSATVAPSDYQLIVGTDSTAVSGGKGNMWETGESDAGIQFLEYAGKPLQPFTKYYWKVNMKDGKGNALLSGIATFETGMMGIHNWEGAWISDGHDIQYKPAPYFRKAFRLSKPVRSARAYIAAAGLYELSLNGEKVGDHFLDPMYTRFDRRVLYVTYDVTNQLQQGANAIGVILGNGWYNHQSLAVWDFDKAPWRGRPAFCLDLRIVYADGSVEVVRSERDWKTSSGPIISNSIYTGEHYDARLEQEGWNKPGFDDSKWQGVRYRSAPASKIISQQLAPIRQTQTFEPIRVNKINDTTYVFDMGQNMSGVTKIRVKGKEGTILKIRHGERLHNNGRVNTSNIDVYYRGDKETDPFQTDILILSGKDDEFMPKYNYKGFRYVEVTSSAPVDLNQNSVTSYFVHSDVKPIGSISTSSALISKLWKATNYSYLSNLMGYPTDCPQREKNGWTGDAHLAIETALYNFDGITVYEKWLADHRDEQQPNGVLPDIIPTGGWGYGTANGLDWTSTIAIIPWQLYLFYGDSRALRDNYENIKRYVNYVDRISPTGLTSFGRGDWVPVKSTSNLELTSSIYFHVDADILAKTSKLLGKITDYKKYDALRQKIKDAINNKFLNRQSGIYGSGTQTELSMALHWKIVPEEMIAKVAANLNRKVEETNFHLDVGVLGAKALLNALNDNGYKESAYKVAVQDTYPSWGWWIVNGATTLLENWNLKAERDISDNHMMFGEIGGWFFKGIGGIRPDENAPGFKNVILAPAFPETLKDFSATHDGPYGKIVSSWKRVKNKIEYEVVIPPNSTATITFPPLKGKVVYRGNEQIKNTTLVQLPSGKHVFVIR
jgi:alpha-L-rhamnosidase